ncbi:hypothetical protein GOP47_0026429 [Adiantum capillus-veneris]|nr:hypothetical protein GOP47_0026429 [Adiantum capillus-veneris]
MSQKNNVVRALEILLFVYPHACFEYNMEEEEKGISATSADTLQTAEMSAGSQNRSAARVSRPTSLFFRDLSASPATRSSSFRGDLGTGGRSAAAALWRDNLGGSEHPPPPILSLEDRIERSPDGVFGESPSRSFDSRLEEVRLSPAKSPVLNLGSRNAITATPNGDLGTSHLFGLPPFQSFGHYRSPSSPNWWSPVKEGQNSNGVLGMKDSEKGGSPVSGVVQHNTQSGGFLTLPVSREIVRPDTSFQFSGNAAENGDVGDDWVTIFGFGAEDTNIVMREFEKCGPIVRHVPGPGGANWIHLQFQSKFDAQKALYKNGMQLNGALIVGVKLLDPLQRQALTERSQRTVFNVLPPKTPTKGAVATPMKASARPYYLQSSGGSQHAAGPIASLSKSIFSKVVDLVFGV